MKKQIKNKEDVIEYISEKTEFEKKVLITTFIIPKGKIKAYPL